MPSVLRNPNLTNALQWQPNPDGLGVGERASARRNAGSCITASIIEFVAKPSEAHKVHAALPAAINSALGEVACFAGSFVMVANHEARLVTVVTLWSGQDRLRRCNENVRWVRALLNPYLDRCLRVQTLAAYVPGTPQSFLQLDAGSPETRLEAAKEEEVLCLV
ncbi:MAG: hypothetical protein ACRD51_12155 [Candidatus Acidiferrum sp.]